MGIAAPTLPDHHDPGGDEMRIELATRARDAFDLGDDEVAVTPCPRGAR